MGSPAKTDDQQGKPGKFQPGQSGNPAGRRKGSRHKATLAALELLDGDLEAITQVCIDKARNGDLLACKLILDKLLPQAKERHINLKLPKVEGAEGIPAALSAILQAVAAGKITVSEGQGLAQIVASYRRNVDLSVQIEEVQALDLSDFTDEELSLLVSVGLKLKGEDPAPSVSAGLAKHPEA